MQNDNKKAVKEMLKSFAYLLNEAMKKTTKSVDAIVESFYGDNAWKVRYNGMSHIIKIYGHGKPEINSIIKVFIPQGNQSLAWGLVTARPSNITTVAGILPDETGNIPLTPKDIGLETKIYNCWGTFLSSSFDDTKGSGAATVTVLNDYARIDFSVTIDVGGTVSDQYVWGISADLLKRINPNLPPLEPIFGGVQTTYNPDGTINTDRTGKGGMFEAQGRYWLPGRVYNSYGAEGGWSPNLYTPGMRIVGVCYGRVVE